jgi:hypothetical protein
MTITQRLLILEDRSLQVTDSFDLLHKHIYHVDLFSKQLHSLVEQLDEEDQSMHGVVADAFFMSFRAYKGRLFLLGFNDMCVGSLSNWADRLLALMEAGDFVAAIRLATSYYKGDAEMLTVGLPVEDGLRHEMVQEKLLEMMLASLRYVCGKTEDDDRERIQQTQLSDLAEACIASCDAMGDHDFLFDEAYSWYEECGAEGVFLDVLEPYIVQGNVRTLPPPAVKALITNFVTNHTASRLEEIICMLDTRTMDIDQVTSLCKEYNLYDAYIYVWNRTLRDYVEPLENLVDFIQFWQDNRTTINGNTDPLRRDPANAMKIFPYLSYVLTGRVYPTGEEMDESESFEAKTAIYRFLFSGTSPRSEGSKRNTMSRPTESFEIVRTILEFDTPSFMSVLNEAFEDSYLNDSGDQTNSGTSEPGITEGTFHGSSINRQYLISILLEIMDPAASQFGPTDTIYLDMFIARNLPKYPQYILLSGSTLQQVLVRICDYPSPEMLEDCQLSAEYLLSTYHPPDIQSLIPPFKAAGFFRILKSTYRAERQYSDLLLTYLEDPDDRAAIFDCIHECLRPGSTLSKKQRRDMRSVIENNPRDIAEIDVARTSEAVQALVPDLHTTFLKALDEDPAKQYRYLDTLFEPDWKSKTEGSPAARFDRHLVERYISLMCQHDPSRVPDFVDKLSAGDLNLESVLPSIESSGILDAAIILLARQGEVSDAMDRLTKHLGTLEAGLSGILRSVEESPDSASTFEAVKDLVESLTKYTRVGIWLCQEQTKAARKASALSKFSKRVSSLLGQPLSFDESLWLSLIDSVVRISQSISPLLSKDMPAPEKGDATDDLEQFTPSLRGLVHQVFTALLTSTTKSGDMSDGKTDISFLRVLRAFLTRAVAASPSLSELRTVIGSIFSAYTYEASLLSLANSMLDKDLFVRVDGVTKLRQRGWRPRGQVCEVCRRRTWGPGAGGNIWTAWEKRQAEQAKRINAQRAKDRDAASRVKGKSSAPSPLLSETADESLPPPEDAGEPAKPVIVFGCRHIFHVSCLIEERERQGLYGDHHRVWEREFCCLICTVHTQ